MATGDLISLDEYKEARRMRDPLDDTELARLITVASRWLANELGREFYQATGAVVSSRKFDPPRGSTEVLVDDFSTVTGLVVVDAGTTLTIDSDFAVSPVNGRSASGETVAYYRLCKFNEAEWSNTEQGPTVVVTALWGWASVPAPVKQGVIQIVGDLLTSRDNSFGIVGIDAGLASRLKLNTYVEALSGDYARGDRAKRFGLA